MRGVEANNGLPRKRKLTTCTKDEGGGRRVAGWNARELDGSVVVVVDRQELTVNRLRSRSGSTEPAQTDLVDVVHKVHL